MYITTGIIKLNGLQVKFEQCIPPYLLNKEEILKSQNYKMKYLFNPLSIML